MTTEDPTTPRGVPVREVTAVALLTTGAALTTTGAALTWGPGPALLVLGAHALTIGILTGRA